MKTILIDDERLALEYLEYQLLDIGDIDIIGKFTNPNDAIEFIKKKQIQLVFLDIQMPEIDGLQMAEKIINIKSSINIVFVTAYDNYAVKAFELNALDYILKPVKKERLRKTLDRLKIEKTNHFEEDIENYLCLNLFKNVSISINNKTIHLNWRTYKAEQLFLYLVQNKNRCVHRTEILDLIWEDFDFNKGLQQLYASIYQIRRTLKPFEKNIKIINNNNGYMLELNNIKLDVDEFDKIVKSNLPLNKDTVEYYEKAIGFVKGEYLDGYDYKWCEIERQRLLLSWIQVTLNLIKWYYKNGEWDDGINLCLMLIKRYSWEEEVYFYLMKFFKKQGNFLKIDETYKNLKLILKEEINESVSSYIEKWYESCKKAR